MGRRPNPEMLFLARESRGYTLERLGNAVGVSAGLLSKVERELSQPKEELIEAIASELGYPARLFYRPEHVRGTDSPCFHHRKRKSTPAKLLNRIEAQMFLAQLQVKRMLDDLDIEAALSIPLLDPDEEGSPEDVARAVRRYWRLPRGPIANMIQTLEATGSVVVLRDFGTNKLDGMSSWARGCPPLFYINSRIPTDRMRWTLAHELGHLVMHSRITSGNQEDEANRFGMEFLAPADELKNDLRNLTLVRLGALKSYWGVSMIALIRAAGVLGAVPANRQRSLYVQLSRNGWRTDEPNTLPPEAPALLAEAMKVHTTQRGYSDDELASIADLEPEEFRDLYGQEPRRLRAV
jgi:Zn-dependent peptidase ImmA (M78 family)